MFSWKQPMSPGLNFQGENPRSAKDWNDKIHFYEWDFKIFNKNL